MPKFDPAKFNTDPKHAEEREFLDAIVEESAKRIYAKLKKNKAPEPETNIFDTLFGAKGEE